MLCEPRIHGERETEGKRRRKKKHQALIQNIWNHYTLMVVHSRRTAIIIMMTLARLSFFFFFIWVTETSIQQCGSTRLIFFYQISLYIKHKKKRVGKKRKGEQEKVNGGNHSNKYKNKWKDFKKERKGKRVYGRTEVVSRIANQLLREFDCPTVNWKHGRAFMTTSETFLQQQTKKKHQEKRLVAYYYHFQTRQWY